MSFKLRSVLLLALFMLIFCGCSKSKEKEIQVALVTDVGTVEDGSFNESAFNGMKQYCEERGIKYSYFIPENVTNDSYKREIEKAINKGAEIIICPGYMLEEAVYDESKNTNVSFILIDGEPHNADYSDTEIPKNVMSILFAEEEAGFLAGYAAVRDGYSKLGFIGGMPEDPVIRYGYGFVQGADYAAIELGIKVNIIYTYANTFLEDEKVCDFAVNAYTAGDADIIFACGGAMGLSVMKAAEKTGGKVIGVDVDQSRESYTVLFSALKNVQGAVYDGLKAYFDDAFEGGRAKIYTASEDGVGLNIINAFFNRFSEIEYNAIYNELKSNEIQPYNQTDVGTTSELNLVNTKVMFVAPEVFGNSGTSEE